MDIHKVSWLLELNVLCSLGCFSIHVGDSISVRYLLILNPRFRSMFFRLNLIALNFPNYGPTVFLIWVGACPSWLFSASQGHWTCAYDWPGNLLELWSKLNHWYLKVSGFVPLIILFFSKQLNLLVFWKVIFIKSIFNFFYVFFAIKKVNQQKILFS
jgi:hypothetical protein